MGQTTQETLDELQQHFATFLSPNIHPLASVEPLIGDWSSIYWRLPDATGGTFAFRADQTLHWVNNSTGLDVKLFYRLPISGVLVLHTRAEDMVGHWEHSPCYNLLFAFLTEDHGIVLSNDDTSIAYVLSAL